MTAPGTRTVPLSQKADQSALLSRGREHADSLKIIITPWTEVHQASLSITNSWSLLRLVSIESVRPSNKYYSVTKNWVTEASLQWSSIKCEWKSLSRVWLFVTPQTVACQASLSMEFSRQKNWSGLLFPPPGDLPDPGIEPVSPASPALQADSLQSEPTRGTPKQLIPLAFSYVSLSPVFFPVPPHIAWMACFYT